MLAWPPTPARPQHMGRVTFQDVGRAISTTQRWHTGNTLELGLLRGPRQALPTGVGVAGPPSAAPGVWGGAS